MYMANTKFIMIVLAILMLFFAAGCENKVSEDANSNSNSNSDKGTLSGRELEKAEISALGIIDAAKLYYTQSLIDDTMIVKATGNDVKKLNTSGIEILSGTWGIDSKTGVITLHDVVFDDYKCSGSVNTISCTYK